MNKSVTTASLLLFSMVLSVAVSMAQGQEERERDGEVLTWVLNKYRRVVDTLLPPGLEDPVIPGRWRAQVRILTATPNEFYVRIDKDFEGPRRGGVAATVIVPEGGSFQEQLEKLRKSRDSLTVEEALPTVADEGGLPE